MPSKIVVKSMVGVIIMKAFPTFLDIMSSDPLWSKFLTTIGNFKPVLEAPEPLLSLRRKADISFSVAGSHYASSGPSRPYPW